MTCCFFGHKDAPPSVYKKLENTIERLILQHGASTFLVGNQGNFDQMALRALRQLQKAHPQIQYRVVLAYMPSGTDRYNPCAYSETLLPEGIEVVPPKFAISWRNKWLAKEADCVIAYITHPWGGAWQFVELAKRKNKKVINLATLTDNV